MNICRTSLVVALVMTSQSYSCEGDPKSEADLPYYARKQNLGGSYMPRKLRLKGILESYECILPNKWRLTLDLLSNDNQPLSIRGHISYGCLVEQVESEYANLCFNRMKEYAVGNEVASRISRLIAAEERLVSPTRDKSAVSFGPLED